MFENIRKKIGHYLLQKRFCRNDYGVINYNNSIFQSTDFLILMPMDDKDFYQSLNLIKYFLNERKHITLFLPEFKYNLIPEKDKYKFISYHVEQINKLFLPEKSLEARLKNKEFDVVIDLNRSENLFYSAAASIVKAKIRVGFSKVNSEKYYNLLYIDKNSHTEAVYINFLNFLKMF